MMILEDIAVTNNNTIVQATVNGITIIVYDILWNNDKKGCKKVVYLLIGHSGAICVVFYSKEKGIFVTIGKYKFSENLVSSTR